MFCMRIFFLCLLPLIIFRRLFRRYAMPLRRHYFLRFRYAVY